MIDRSLDSPDADNKPDKPERPAAWPAGQVISHGATAEAFYHLIIELYKSIMNPFEQMRKMPIPPSHVKVVFFLKHHGPASISCMAAHLDISKPNMTPIIDKLIKEGLVRRYQDPGDRRMTIIESTPQAAALIQQSIEAMKQNITAKLTRLSAADLAELDTLIVRMEAIIGKFQD